MIAIIINTKDRVTELTMLLQSLIYQTEQDFDIFIMDDASGQAPTQHHFFNCVTNVLKIDHGIFYTRNDFCDGVATARQKIVDWVRTFPKKYDYYLRLDDDCFLKSDYIEQLLEVINKGYDIASGVTIPCGPVFKKEPKFSGNIINRVILDKDGNHIYNADDCGRPYTDKIILPGHHFRSCALYKSEVHDKVNYMTKLSPKGFREEQIFSYRLIMNNYKIGINTFAINYHQMTPSGGCRLNNSNILVHQDQETFNKFTKENADKLKKYFKTKPLPTSLQLNSKNNLI